MHRWFLCQRVAFALLIAPLAVLTNESASSQEALQPGESFVTRFSGTVIEDGRPIIDRAGIVGSIIDLRNPGAAPRGAHWLNEPQRLPVTAAHVGQVFGVALDGAAAPNVYVTATSAFGLHRNADNTDWMPGMWGPDGGPGTVYKLNADNNYQPEIFADIALDDRANSGAALGNIAYDRWNQQFYVSDLETGMIHRLRASDGSDLGRYDHGTTGRTSFYNVTSGARMSLAVVAFDPARSARITDCPSGDFARTPSCWNFADFRRRVWGLGVRRDLLSGEVRLYYSVWSSQGFGHADYAAAGDDRRNSLWSVHINGDGAFDASDVRREFVLPDFFRSPEAIARAGRSHPVSDIAFPAFGDQDVMLLAERGGVRNLGLGADEAFATPHEARVLRYALIDDGVWQPSGRYDLGFYDRKDEGPPYLRAGASGGVSFGMGYNDSWQIDPAKADAFVWMTAHGLCSASGPCFDSNNNKHTDSSHVDGLEGLAQSAYEEIVPDAAFQPYPEPGPATQATGPDRSFMIDADINVDASGTPIAAELARNDATRIGDVVIAMPAPPEEVPEGWMPPGWTPEDWTPPADWTPSDDWVPPDGWIPPDDWTPPDDWDPPPWLEEAADLAVDKVRIDECVQGVPGYPEIWRCIFTITITNEGDVDFDGPIEFSDQLTGGGWLSFYTPGPHGWTCEPVGLPSTDAEITCRTPHVRLTARGGSTEVIVGMRFPDGFDPAALDDNCAQLVAPADDPNGNNRDCAPFEGEEEEPPVEPENADLAVDKVRIDECVHRPPELGLGYDCRFTVTITNGSGVDFSGPLSFSDQLTGGATLAAFTDDLAHGWACGPIGGAPDQLITCEVAEIDLAAGGDETQVTLRIYVPPGVDPGALEDNCAALVAPADDPNGNNRDCAPFEGEEEEPPVEPEPDLTIEKSRILDCQTEDVPHGGTLCSFAVAVENAGDVAFSDRASFTDQMPPDGILWEFIDASGHGWVCEPTGAPPGQRVTCSTPGLDLPPTGRSNLILRIFLPAGTSPADMDDNCTEIAAPADDPDTDDGPNRDCAPFAGAEGEPSANFDLEVFKRGPAWCVSGVTQVPGGAWCDFTVSIWNQLGSDETFEGSLSLNDYAGITAEDFEGTVISEGDALSPNRILVTSGGWACETSEEYEKCNSDTVRLREGDVTRMQVSVLVPEDAAEDRAVTNCVMLDPPPGEGGPYANQVCVTVPVIQPEDFDLGITKEVLPGQNCRPGDRCAFQVHVENEGSVDVSGTLVFGDRGGFEADWGGREPVLPGNIATSNEWDCSGYGLAYARQCSWTGTLAAGDRKTVTIYVNIPDDLPDRQPAGRGYTVLRNCAFLDWEAMAAAGTYFPGDGQDGNAENDERCDTAAIAQDPAPNPGPADVPSEIDLRIEKRVPDTCTRGEECEFVVTVFNDGPSNYTGPILVRDDLPPDSTDALGTLPGWVCNLISENFLCSLAPLPGEPTVVERFDHRELTVRWTVPEDYPFGNAENCAEVTWVRDLGGADLALAAEVALAAAGFSPGAIDGIQDADTNEAVAAYRDSVGLPAGTVMDPAFFNSLFHGTSHLTSDNYDGNDRHCDTVEIVEAEANLGPGSPSECTRGENCTLDVWLENFGTRPFEGAAGLAATLSPAVPVVSVKAPGMSCKVTGEGAYQCRGDKLGIKPGVDGRAHMTVAVTIPADFPHNAIIHTKDMLWPDLDVKDKHPEDDRHVSTITIKGPKPPTPAAPPPPQCKKGWSEVSRSRAKALRAQGWEIDQIREGDESILCAKAPPIECIGGNVVGDQCQCPKGTERKQTATNAYRCVKLPPPITCTDGKVDKGQCICPKGTARKRTGTNAYRCVKLPPPITCSGGSVRNGQCICPKGTERKKVGANAYKCVKLPPPITCSGGKVDKGQCICPKGTERKKVGANAYRCVKRPPPITCSGGKVDKRQCICPKGTQRKKVGANAYKCVKLPPPITCTGGSVRNGQCICPKGTDRKKVGTKAYKCVKTVKCDPGWRQVGREKAKALVKQGWQIKQVGNILCAKRRK